MKNNIKKFSANHFLSEDAIYIYLFTLFTVSLLFVDMTSQKNPEGFIKGMFLISFFLFVVLTYRMNYFILTTDEIIIKNPVWFWKEIKIPFEEIEKVSLTQPFRSPIKLIIKCKYVKQKSFYSSTLKMNTWRNLKKELLENKIIVDDNIGL
jgi:hypothetical protein